MLLELFLYELKSKITTMHAKCMHKNYKKDRKLAVQNS